MNDSHVVEIFDCVQDLVDELAGISLCVEAFLHDPVKQLASRYPARLKSRVSLYFIWVSRSQAVLPNTVPTTKKTKRILDIDVAVNVYITYI